LKDFFDMSSQAYLLIIATSSCFAFSIIMARYFVGFLSPYTYNTLRLIISSLAYFMLFAMWKRRFRFPKDKNALRHGLVVGIFDTAAPLMLFVFALQYLSSGITAVFVAISPALVIIMAHFFLPDEQLTLQKGFGALLALAGAIALALSGESGIPNIDQANPLGYVFVTSAVLLVVVMTIYTRKYMQGLKTTDIGAIRTWVATICICFLTFSTGNWNTGTTDLEMLLLIIPIAIIGNFLPFLINFYLIKKFGATSGAMTSYVTPIITIIGGAVFLGEIITLQILVSVIAIIIGIILITRKTKAPNQPLY
jgi:drug/metabolite transporter (DMT)-like permease